MRVNRGSTSQPEKAKAVPLHATDVVGGRGCIAPTHSRPRHYMGVSGQRHALAALYSRGKAPRYPLTGGWVASEPVWTQRLEEIAFRFCRGSNLDRPVVEPVARHY
jgi:hypothetical protein